ncbi:MAG: branched-chain amino acid ABC transporter permease [Desulfobacteraceae bacterium]|nr:branched-chain amino acid ABC transporter permease [Desulfobacterales bacterium]MBL6967451.1 branched-chain amino acid ABC transporter permease [Desulfobacteraceae bacterium]MBL7172719.1 branched-chain amino acid ABC transporter permease [Desulfobacteraceae bacterium]
MENLLDQSSLFLQQLVNGITLGGVYALIAVGYTMVYGVIQLINFAHGEIYMLGAFLAYTMVTVLGLPFFAAFVLTILICSCFGIILDFVAYRPLRKAPRLAALITAIGMSIFLQNLALMIWGSQIKSYPREVLPAIFLKPALSVGEVSLSWLQVFILSITVLFMIILHLIIHRTKIGTAMRALSQDKTTSALMGIGVNRVISFTFAIGSAMGGMAGILVGLYYNAIFPTMGYIAGIKAFAAAVLGGIGSVPGAMLGGGVLGIAEVIGAGYISSEYRDGISYAVMIAVILFKPSGLIGKQIGEKV